MKVLVFGAGGMAGHVIVKYLKDQHYTVIPVYSLNAEEEFCIDVTNDAQVQMVIEKTQPDVVINAVGMLVNACEKNPQQAFLVNSRFPHYLVSLSKKFNFRTILLSTDCVFSGKEGQYNEFSFKDETSFYGLSKNYGEVIDNNTLVIRTSIIGPELKTQGIGLLNWFLHQQLEINGYVNAYWNGVTTLELSKFIDYSIKTKINGLVHIHSKDAVSKFTMLNIFKTAYNKHIDIIPTPLPIKIDKTIVRTRRDFYYEEKTVNQLVQELVEYFK